MNTTLAARPGAQPHRAVPAVPPVLGTGDLPAVPAPSAVTDVTVVNRSSAQ
ncbi:hypothetical protein [Streptomyces purpureus]|uniref:Uncharacterized protein n=1 Tax=Streptomyces purpureus TaxID=1951 RepID=A0A918GZ30_9ACTN|nr:hypothetical protein [Streptomyces purpureus]GGT23295.1 hypothetical protein GCM10014713_15180 [Streptomyces purpureus]